MNIITIGFIAVSLALIFWIISSFTQFKKMNDHPEEYKKGGHLSQ